MRRKNISTCVCNNGFTWHICAYASVSRTKLIPNSAERHHAGMSVSFNPFVRPHAMVLRCFGAISIHPVLYPPGDSAEYGTCNVGMYESCLLGCERFQLCFCFVSRISESGATRICLLQVLLGTGYLGSADSSERKRGDGGDPLDDLMQSNGPLHGTMTTNSIAISSSPPLHPPRPFSTLSGA